MLVVAGVTALAGAYLAHTVFGIRLFVTTPLERLPA